MYRFKLKEIEVGDTEIRGGKKSTVSAIDDATGRIEWDIVDAADFSSVYKALSKANDFLSTLEKEGKAKDDVVIDGFAEDIAKLFNAFRTHVRKAYPKEYERVSRLKESITEAKNMTFGDFLDDLDNRFVDILKAAKGLNAENSNTIDMRATLNQNFTLFRNYISALKKEYSDELGKELTFTINEESDLDQIGKKYKKGDKLKIKLKNGNEFDLTFDSYMKQKGMAFGKFDGDTKPFSLDTIKEAVVSDNESSSLKAKIAADDFMYQYRKALRIVDGNFGSEAAEEFKNIVKSKISQLKEEEVEEGEGIGYLTPNAFGKKKKNVYTSQYGYKLVPKKIKGSGMIVKQLFEKTDRNEFQTKRIAAFDEVEERFNNISKLISNAKNETAKYYNENPGSYAVVYSTDYIFELLEEIEAKLLNNPE